MSREQECKWFFAEQSGIDHGPNDPITDIFRGQRYASIVRESIQNSLDAVLDPSQPVRVAFSFKSVNRGDFPNFFDLKKHIKGCLDYYPTNENAKENYEPMLEFFEGRSFSKTIEYIRVSDYNTKGMDYFKGTDSPFYAFVQSEGVSAKKDSSSGGSYGFGKGAYFALSDIRTVVVSTKTAEGKSFFSGIAKLCTNKVNGKIYSFSGFYGDNEQEPVDVPDRIPKPFRREEPGTDINVMAFDFGKKADAVKKMVEAVLRNFWYAIFRNELVVDIDGVEICNENLEELLETYLPSENDTTAKSNNYNPLPYYKAVALSGTADKYRTFSQEIDILGNVKLYTHIDKDATDKVLFMRKLKMLVYAKRTGSSNGIYGVFVCEDERGNEILRCAENSAHDEWKAKYNRSKKISDDKIRAALENIRVFIDNCFRRLFSNREDNTLNITGLENYLYVPEDLLPEETSLSNELEEDSNPFMGTPTGYTIEDSPSITSTANQPVEIADNVPSGADVKIHDTSRIDPNPDTDTLVDTGHTKDHSKEKGGNVAPGDIQQKADIIDDESGTCKKEIQLKYRTFAQVELFKVYHYIIIHAPYSVSFCELDILLTGEEKDTIPEIIQSDHGVIEGNQIKAFPLKEGKNIIKVRFNDNMKFAINLKAYEIQ